MTQTAPPWFARASAIPSSWLYESFRLANERERERPGLIKLHVGEPAFSPPDSVAKEFAAAAVDGRARYIDVQGLMELRERLVDKLDTVNHIDTEPSRLFVTPGSCQGLSALMRTLADSGAEILVPEIHWPVHLQQVLLAGFRPVFYKLDEHFAPDPESIRQMATPATRVLLLNTPSNPTGAVIGLPLQRTLYEIADEHGWQIISDEAYEDFAFFGPHLSIAALERDRPAPERIVNSVFTFSKGLAMTGYRLGYVAVSQPRIAAAMRPVQESCIIAPSAPVQYAGLAALDTSGALVGNHDFVRGNRDAALSPLVTEGLLPALPGGGWYAMADISSTGLTGEEFSAELMLHHDVVVVPGSGFSARPEFAPDGSMRPLKPGGVASGMVRIAFCVDRGQLATGVERLIGLVREKREQ
ncbi:pyridoxal phosphate-dependent aminotransferase [Streptomyces sp. NPDC021080]|uniref:pyridoxal phosphate-dependent aminotransferase n=1 Tax=Streptomyces sp. NPDC021080 TaxID=3365110 RepID=UPI00379A3BDF